MITFLKANLSSSIASLVDYLVTILLVSFFRIDIVIASATGTICGGIINFLIGRYWVFVSKTEKSDKVSGQAFRYAIVWLGNLILNTGGVFVFTKVLRIHYAISKIVVSLIVAFGYNYILQKKFVFKNNRRIQ